MDEAAEVEAFAEFMRIELQNNDDLDLMKWATCDTEEDEREYAAYRKDYVSLMRCRRRKVELLRQLEKGGRQRKQAARYSVYHRRVLEDYFGIPAFSADGVLHDAVPPFFRAPKFHRCFRMSPRMFMKLYHDITDTVTGSDEFQRGPDCTGVMGIHPLCKLVSVMRQLAYGHCGDSAEEYTGVARKSGTKALYAFCNWIDTFHGPTFLGAWTEEAVRTTLVCAPNTRVAPDTLARFASLLVISFRVT